MVSEDSVSRLPTIPVRIRRFDAAVFIQQNEDSQWPLGEVTAILGWIQATRPENRRSFVRNQASHGDAHAQARACVISMASGDATHEYGEAARWCALAASTGNSEAQSLYARQYQFGLGIAQDNQLAIEWYEKAAAQQNAQAMYMLVSSSRNATRLPMRHVALRCCNEPRRLEM
jgi:TPR repeat protein